MKLSISEILAQTSKLRAKQAKVDYLRENASGPLYQILKYTFDPRIVWALPEGVPPYKPTEAIDVQARLYQEARRLYLFVEGGNDNLNPIRRETLFIQLLESIDPDDAKLIASIKDKKMPYKGIDEALIKEAFPGLLEQDPKLR